MGSLFRRRNNKNKLLPNWYCRFMVDNKDYWISTGTSDKREAKKIMERKEAEIRGDLSIDDCFDSLLNLLDQIPEKRQDQKRKDLARVLMSGSKSKLLIEDAWRVWLDHPNRGNQTPNTLSDYQRTWDKFKSWASKRNLEYLHDISRQDALDYCAGLWKQNISPRTYNKQLTFLRGYFDVLKINAGLAENAWDGIKKKEGQTESRREFTPKELKKVCQNATGDLKYMLAIGLYTGMRLGDVVSLKWKEIDSEQRIITHIPNKTRRKNKTVRLALHPVLHAMLSERKLSSTSQRVFPEMYRRYQDCEQSVIQEIQQYFKECGIQTTEKPDTKHRKRAIVRIGFHSLRHSFVSLCAANSVPQSAIMDMVGHGSPAMTRLYTHAGDEQKAKAIAGLPVIIFKKETA